jgi:hypothetical protein
MFFFYSLTTVQERHDMIKAYIGNADNNIVANGYVSDSTLHYWVYVTSETSMKRKLKVGDIVKVAKSIRYNDQYNNVGPFQIISIHKHCDVLSLTNKQMYGFYETDLELVNPRLYNSGGNV